MIYSMTGYGQASLHNKEFKVDVEIRSVNHRFSEITVRMPRQLLSLEDAIKKIVQKEITRGKIDVFVSIDGTSFVSRNIEVDWELLGQMIDVSNKMKQQHLLSDAGLLPSFMQHDKIVSIQEEHNLSEEQQQFILTSVKQALEQLITMRKREGQSLYTDFTSRLENMKSILSDIVVHAPSVQESYRQRLYKRVKEFTNELLELDEARLMTEVAIFADKANIDEELTRLFSHIAQFLDIIQAGGTSGKKLDFLVQEMNREANTIGSKANDIHISKQVVNLKSEIEKLKEQVQNIE